MAGREKPKSPGGEPTIRESKSALLEAAQAAVADRKGRPSQQPFEWKPEGNRTAFRSILGSLMMAGAVLLVWQPEWLAGPKLPKESVEIKVASATLSLVEAASQVRAYKSVTGRLPSKLQDAGVTNLLVNYRRVDTENFLVSLAAGDSTVTLRSTDSIRPLVVEAIRALQRRS